MSWVLLHNGDQPICFVCSACSYTVVMLISEWRSGAYDQNSFDWDRWLVDEPGVSITIVTYYFNSIAVFCWNIFKNVIYSCEGKAECAASLLQSSVSHDPSEIILICLIWCSRKNIKWKFVHVKMFTVIFTFTLINLMCTCWIQIFFFSKSHWPQSFEQQYITKDTYTFSLYVYILYT